VNVTTGMFSFRARAGAAVVILSIAAGLSACGEKGKQGTAVSRPVVQDVEVVVVRPVPRETTAEALGTVRARTTAAVAPQVMGRLTAVAVSEGSVVAAGALLATIDETLGLENTLVVYSSDHGDVLGLHGIFWKTNFYEGSARVPFVFSCPGVVSRRWKSERKNQPLVLSLSKHVLR